MNYAIEILSERITGRLGPANVLIHRSDCGKAGLAAEGIYATRGAAIDAGHSVYVRGIIECAYCIDPSNRVNAEYERYLEVLQSSVHKETSHDH